MNRLRLLAVPGLIFLVLVGFPSYSILLEKLDINEYLDLSDKLKPVAYESLDGRQYFVLCTDSKKKSLNLTILYGSDNVEVTSFDFLSEEMPGSQRQKLFRSIPIANVREKESGEISQRRFDRFSYFLGTTMQEPGLASRTYNLKWRPVSDKNASRFAQSLTNTLTNSH